MLQSMSTLSILFPGAGLASNLLHSLRTNRLQRRSGPVDKQLPVHLRQFRQHSSISLQVQYTPLFITVSIHHLQNPFRCRILLCAVCFMNIEKECLQTFQSITSWTFSLNLVRNVLVVETIIPIRVFGVDNCSVFDDFAHSQRKRAGSHSKSRYVYNIHPAYHSSRQSYISSWRCKSVEVV